MQLEEQREGHEGKIFKLVNGQTDLQLVTQISHPNCPPSASASPGNTIANWEKLEVCKLLPYKACAKCVNVKTGPIVEENKMFQKQLGFDIYICLKIEILHLNYWS